MNDSDDLIKIKKNAFEAWSTMVSTRGPDKRKYGKLMHDFSIQYTIKNNQYTKPLQESVDVMRRKKFKPENKDDKVTHKNRKKWRW